MIDLDKEKVESNSFDEQAYRKNLELYGDSLLVAGDDGLVKVHIHTEKPGEVMTLSQQYGDLMNIDVENMRKQYEAIISEDAAKKMNSETIDIAKVVVTSRNGLNTMIKSLRGDYIIEGCQTMNPSTEDILTTFYNIISA